MLGDAGAPHAGAPHAGAPHAGAPHAGAPHAGAPHAFHAQHRAPDISQAPATQSIYKFGFRSKCSTAAALSGFDDEVLLNMEKGNI